MTRLHYNLNDLRELRSALVAAMARYRQGQPFEVGFGGFLTISCRDDEGRETSITTNAHGEGLFHWNSRQGCYDQSMGTCQFSMAGWSDRRARQALREQWEQVYEAGYC